MSDSERRSNFQVSRFYDKIPERLKSDSSLPGNRSSDSVHYFEGESQYYSSRFSHLPEQQIRLNSDRNSKGDVNYYSREFDPLETQTETQPADSSHYFDRERRYHTDKQSANHNDYYRREQLFGETVPSRSDECLETWAHTNAQYSHERADSKSATYTNRLNPAYLDGAKYVTGVRPKIYSTQPQIQERRHSRSPETTWMSPLSEPINGKYETPTRNHKTSLTFDLNDVSDNRFVTSSDDMENCSRIKRHVEYDTTAHRRIGWPETPTDEHGAYTAGNKASTKQNFSSSVQQTPKNYNDFYKQSHITLLKDFGTSSSMRLSKSPVRDSDVTYHTQTQKDCRYLTSRLDEHQPFDSNSSKLIGKTKVNYSDLGLDDSTKMHSRKQIDGATRIEDRPNEKTKDVSTENEKCFSSKISPKPVLPPKPTSQRVAEAEPLIRNSPNVALVKERGWLQNVKEISSLGLNHQDYSSTPGKRPEVSSKRPELPPKPSNQKMPQNETVHVVTKASSVRQVNATAKCCKGIAVSNSKESSSSTRPKEFHNSELLPKSTSQRVTKGATNSKEIALSNRHCTSVRPKEFPKPELHLTSKSYRVTERESLVRKSGNEATGKGRVSSATENSVERGAHKIFENRRNEKPRRHHSNDRKTDHARASTADVSVAEKLNTKREMKDQRTSKVNIQSKVNEQQCSRMRVISDAKQTDEYPYGTRQSTRDQKHTDINRTRSERKGAEKNSAQTERYREARLSEREKVVLAGYQKLEKETFVVIKWCTKDVRLITEDEIQQHLETLAEFFSFTSELSVVETKQNENGSDAMSAIVKLKSKNDAKNFAFSLNDTNNNTGIKAEIRSLSDVQVEALRKAHWQDIQLKLDRPLLEHQAKKDELLTQLETLRDDPRSRNYHTIGQVMQEIAAVEHKIEELNKQSSAFERFVQSLKQSYDNLKYVPKDNETKAEELRSSFERELKRFETSLPMYAHKEKIVSFVANNQVCVIIGETGSGKSTQLAQYLHEAHILHRSAIACTQPRKVAATSLAERVSTEMKCHPGELVGYNVGMNRKLSKNTAITYMTDHILLRECLKDPDLSSYGCIIVDEAHERSIYTDLLLGMIKKLLPRRPDLKVIITSATINPAVFVSYFSGCPVMTVSGRAFPVDVHYDVTDHVDDYFVTAIEKAKSVHEENAPGDVLIFLTTPLETEKACEKLIEKLKNPESAVVLPLHGQLQPTEQNRVFEPTLAGKRKIVFATNCAETSITIPGITYVIDAGYVKERIYDTKRSVNALKVVNITRSSAEQRKGRAGRTQAGTCFRLYTKDTFDKFRPNTTPEIMTMHLGQAFLQFMTLKVRNPLSFDYVESPPRESLQKAATLLEELGAAKYGEITEFGLKLAKLSLEPRLGKFVLEGINEGIDQEVAIIAAIFSTGASLFFRAGSDEEKDKADRLKTMFCQKEGDLVTLLNVFKFWSSINEKQKNKWCVENSLNAKSARIIRDSLKEITYTLKPKDIRAL